MGAYNLQLSANSMKLQESFPLFLFANGKRCYYTLQEVLDDLNHKKNNSKFKNLSAVPVSPESGSVASSELSLSIILNQHPCFEHLQMFTFPWLLPIKDSKSYQNTNQSSSLFLNYHGNRMLTYHEYPCILFSVYEMLKYTHSLKLLLSKCHGR